MTTGVFATNPGSGGSNFAGDLVATEIMPISKIDIGAVGASSLVTDANAMPVAGVRRDSDALAGTDGGKLALNLNRFGRLKVSVAPADLTVVTGSITAAAQNVSTPVALFSNLSISMIATTLVGHNASFEVSNNSTNGTDGQWYAVQAVRSNANTVETTTGVLTATPVYMWQLNVSDYQYFRVRAAAHTSGTAAYILSPSPYVSEPVPSAQVTATQPVSGAVTVSGTATTTPVTPSTTFTNSAATTNATLIKNTAGTLWSIVVSNVNAATRFLKLYNLTVAPTVGTSVPVFTIAIPTGGTVTIQGGSNGLRFSTGISLAITAAAADADATAVAAGDVKVATSFT